MRGHGDKGRRDEEGEKKAPPLFTPLWGSPPGGPPIVLPDSAMPEAPEPPEPPASEQTLSPRISLPPPVKPRRLKPRELRKKPTPEPRQPHAFDNDTAWFLKKREMKMKPRSGIIIVALAIGLVALITTVVGGKSKTSTTTTPKSSPAVSAQSASGTALLVALNSPRENEVVESGTINVTGRVTGYGSQNVSGTTVTVSIQAGHVATGTTDQQGSFSVPIQLLPHNNYMDIQASLGGRSGSSTRTCFYSCDPETYKAACAQLDYAMIIYSTDAHKHERYTFNGRVDSTELNKGEINIYMDTAFRDGEWTDPVVVRADIAQMAFPGDIIQVWGELTGQVTYMDVRMLQIEAAYIVTGAP